MPRARAVRKVAYCSPRSPEPASANVAATDEKQVELSLRVSHVAAHYRTSLSATSSRGNSSSSTPPYPVSRAAPGTEGLVSSDVAPPPLPLALR